MGRRPVRDGGEHAVGGFGVCHGAGDGRSRGGGGHPQQLAPEAMASALAAVPQHPPEAWASAAVPQQVDAVVSAVTVWAGALPQQPPVDGGVNASAELPANPPVAVVSVVSVLMAGLLI
jgi:hypothetical protein